MRLVHRLTTRRVRVWLGVAVAVAMAALGLLAAGQRPAAADPTPHPAPATGVPNSGAHPAPSPRGTGRAARRPSTLASRAPRPTPHRPDPRRFGQPSPRPAPTDSTNTSEDPALYDIPGQVRAALTGFVSWLAHHALKQVMDTLGSTLLASPDVTGNGRVRTIWTTSLVTANAVFVLLIVAGGLVVSANDTLHTRYGLREILPRLGVAAVLSNTSLIVCCKAITAANALTAAIAGQGVNPKAAARYLTVALDRLQHSGTFLISILELGIVVMALVVVITFILRTALLVILVGIAPLALALHALPQTEALAYTWWRSLAACLGIQIGQAVVLLAAVRVFLSPTDSMFLGLPNSKNSLLNVLVALAMLWLLVKIPGLMKRFALGGQGGRGLVRQVVSTILMVKTLGAATGLITTSTRHSIHHTARQASRPARRVPAASGRTRPLAAAAATASRRPPAGTATTRFSHAPTTHTPLRGPAGHAAAPTFSHRTPTPPPLPADGSAFRQPPAFSDQPTPTAAPRPPTGSVGPPAFSHAPATPTAIGQRPPPPPPPRPGFSDAPPTQSAPRRPPPPTTTPTFSDRPRPSPHPGSGESRKEQ